MQEELDRLANAHPRFNLRYITKPYKVWDDVEPQDLIPSLSFNPTNFGILNTYLSF